MSTETDGLVAEHVVTKSLIYPVGGRRGDQQHRAVCTCGWSYITVTDHHLAYVAAEHERRFAK